VSHASYGINNNSLAQGAAKSIIKGEESKNLKWTGEKMG
jgi:hypothetical protein